MIQWKNILELEEEEWNDGYYLAKMKGGYFTFFSWGCYNAEPNPRNGYQEAIGWTRWCHYQDGTVELELKNIEGWVRLK